MNTKEKLAQIEEQIQANNKLLKRLIKMMQPDHHVPINIKHFISSGKKKGLTALQTLEEVNRVIEDRG